MGYSLVFYSLDWRTLCNSLMSPRQQDMASVRQSQWEQLLRERAPEEVEAAWVRARRELSGSLTSGALRPEPPVILGRDAALLFVAMVQHLGQGLGELDHASASGEEFLEEFLGNVAATFFEVPDLTEWLTDRSVCELTSEVLPTWGGIRQGELSQMLLCSERKRQETVEMSEDCALWLEELLLILREAKSARHDLVSLYI